MKLPINANKFMFFLILYLVFIPFAIPFILAVGGSQITTPQSYTLVIMFATPFLCSLFPLLFYLFVTRQNFTDVIPLKKLSLKNVFLIVGMSFFIQPIANFVALITSVFFENTASAVLYEISDIPFILYLLIAAVFPAVFEEIIFRGLLLKGYEKTGIFVSAFMTGLFFGLMHLNPHQFFYAFLVGIIFAYFVRYTGSVLSSIISHFTINATQASLLYLVARSPVYEEVVNSQTQVVSLNEFISVAVVAIVCGVFFSAIFIYFKKINSENISSEEIKGTLSFKNAFNIYIPLIFVIYAVFVVIFG